MVQHEGSWVTSMHVVVVNGWGVIRVCVRVSVCVMRVCVFVLRVCVCVCDEGMCVCL